MVRQAGIHLDLSAVIATYSDLLQLLKAATNYGAKCAAE